MVNFVCCGHRTTHSMSNLDSLKPYFTRHPRKTLQALPQSPSLHHTSTLHSTTYKLLAKPQELPQQQLEHCRAAPSQHSSRDAAVRFSGGNCCACIADTERNHLVSSCTSNNCPDCFHTAAPRGIGHTTSSPSLCCTDIAATTQRQPAGDRCRTMSQLLTL